MLFGVEFDRDIIRLVDYPFAPVGAGPEIHVGDIVAISQNGMPPMVQLEGEIIFIPAPKSEELYQFARENNLPVRWMYDIWGDLLEPYLDTELTPKYEAVINHRMDICGIDAAGREEIRRVVGPRVLAYNSLIWDWVHLGFMDLMEASRRKFSGEHKVSDSEFEELYRWAMDIAMVGIRHSEEIEATDYVQTVLRQQEERKK